MAKKRASRPQYAMVCANCCRDFFARKGHWACPYCDFTQTTSLPASTHKLDPLELEQDVIVRGEQDGDRDDGTI